jgi:hypothetical protein
VDPAGYLKLALENFDFANPGAFYGAARERSLGAGLVYAGVVFPLFNEERGDFDTVRGLAYVVTHECDVDQSNNRHFSDLVVICPLIPLHVIVRDYEAVLGEEQLKSLLVSVAKNEVFRVFFLPPTPDLLGVPALRGGALLYLNQLCSTHVSVFARAIPVCALSRRGIERLDWKLQNSLFRPKTEGLPEVG